MKPRESHPRNTYDGEYDEVPLEQLIGKSASPTAPPVRRISLPTPPGSPISGSDSVFARLVRFFRKTKNIDIDIVP